MSSGIVVPEELADSHAMFFGAAGRVWIDALPGLAAACLERWQLTLDGPTGYGAVALILPVRCADDTPAVLKLQPVDDETGGEPAALRAWQGHGAVGLLRHDADTGSMLLERLDADRSLDAIPDDLAALRILTELMAGLHAVPAPPGIRHLRDVAAAMLDRVPHALATVADPDERRLIDTCASAVADLVTEPGDRLLHWDLHFYNVLATLDDPQRWLAIDPKPLVGDPGFELLAALHNRWDDVVATGDVPRAVCRRFDLMTDVLGLDRQRAIGWTLARILQNALWEAENSDTAWSTEPDRAIARALLRERAGDRQRAAALALQELQQPLPRVGGRAAVALPAEVVHLEEAVRAAGIDDDLVRHPGPAQLFVERVRHRRRHERVGVAEHAEHRAAQPRNELVRQRRISAQLTGPRIERDDTGEREVGGTGVQRGSATHAEADQERRCVEVLDRGPHVVQQRFPPELLDMRAERPVCRVRFGTRAAPEVVDGERDAAGGGEHRRQFLVERHQPVVVGQQHDVGTGRPFGSGQIRGEPIAVGRDQFDVGTTGRAGDPGWCRRPIAFVVTHDVGGYRPSIPNATQENATTTAGTAIRSMSATGRRNSGRPGSAGRALGATTPGDGRGAARRVTFAHQIRLYSRNSGTTAGPVMLHQPVFNVVAICCR
jgi:streptomycin 6-kinase